MEQVTVDPETLTVTDALGQKYGVGDRVVVTLSRGNGSSPHLAERRVVTVTARGRDIVSRDAEGNRLVVGTWYYPEVGVTYDYPDAKGVRYPTVSNILRHPNQEG